jgi:hypothetical protein
VYLCIVLAFDVNWCTSWSIVKKQIYVHGYETYKVFFLFCVLTREHFN